MPQKFPKDILTLLRSFHPYKGENDFIWALNMICVINKHRIIAPIGIVSGAVVEYSTSVGTTREIRKLSWNREKNEIIFFIFERDARIEYDVNIALDVAFDEAPVAYQRPVLGTLKHMKSIVGNILDRLERMTRALGFI